MSDWKVPRPLQPKPDAYSYDLDRALASVVGLSAIVPSDAFTAETLGTERAGSGVVIREDGLVLTIGYLVTEAASVWLSLGDGRVVAGDVVAIDGESGLALIQPLSRLDAPALPVGRSETAKVGDEVVIAGAGGRTRAVASRIVAKQEYAGYWEYLLDEAIFVAPAHPNWGGTALIDATGALIGIGSLQLQADRAGRSHNMVVPIDLLAPIRDTLLTQGATSTPARPWLGIYATALDNGHVAIADVVGGGPAETAGLRQGDVVLSIGPRDTRDLASLFRAIWATGPAGTAIPMRIAREGRVTTIEVASVDRRTLLRRPRLH